MIEPRREQLVSKKVARMSAGLERGVFFELSRWGILKKVRFFAAIAGFSLAKTTGGDMVV